MSYSIAIVAPSSVPFQIGGAEKFWWGLHGGLSQWSDHFVELIKIPSPENDFARIVQSYKTFSRLDLSHFDMVISSKYPAWMVRHPNHVLYMQHTLRGLYDTYHFTGLPETLVEVPAPLKDLVALARKERPDRDDVETMFELAEAAQREKSLPSALFAFPGPLIRELVHFFDRAALAPGQIATYMTISDTVRRRKDYLPKEAQVTVLPHPSDIGQYFCNRGEYIFTASRLNATKRVGLIVDAMRHVGADVPLKIAGTGPELENLIRKAESDRRIEFLGHVPDADLPDYYSHAIFVPFVPYDEDYGLITIEAMSSSKPVVTVSDAGGVCEFVENGITGLCVEPTPQALGAAMHQLASDPALAQKMGAKARQKVDGISWKNVTISMLFQNSATKTSSTWSSRGMVIVCSVFPAFRYGSGGPRRLFHLCAGLSRHYDVMLVCMGNKLQSSVKISDKDYYLEVSLPWPEDAVQESYRLERETGISPDDIAMMRHCAHCADLADVLATFGRKALCVLTEHPYLYPAIAETLPHAPLIYDAPNVEAELKAGIYTGQWAGIAEEVKKVEKDCCAAADRVICCSREDGEHFERLYGLSPEKICYVPNGCDCDKLEFRDHDQRRALRRKLAFPDARLALFLGSGHKPNIEAVGHILQIAKKMPHVQFLIGGGVSAIPEVRNQEHSENAHFLGILSEPVKNMLLECADVGLNPMTSGSGTNLKMIECMAVGLPGVSTTFGMRGLEGDFEGIVRVCELEEFPAAIDETLAHPARETGGKCAAIVRNYDWSHVMEALTGIVESIAAPQKS